MPEQVEIVIVAKDAASAALRGITSSMGQLGSVINGVANTAGAYNSVFSAKTEKEKQQALDQLNVAYTRLVEQGLSMVIDFGKQSVKSFTEGAQAAKQLSMISGESIEETSRFIQVLDDFGLTQQDALTATRALTKQGLTPSLETLIKLSDQYKKIQDPQKQNEFILKNLGKAGLEWVKVLNQEHGALVQRGQDVSKNLIFTEKMYQDAERLRLSQDDLNDSWEETKIQVGGALVPALTSAINHINALNFADQKLREEGLTPGTKAYMDRRMEIINSIKAEQEQRQSIDGVTSSLDNSSMAYADNEEDLKAQEEAVKELTKRNQDYLSSLADVSQGNASYRSSMDELIAEHSTLIAEKSKLVAEGWWPESNAIRDVNKKLDENAQKQIDLTVTHQQESHKRMVAALEEYALQGGLTDEEVGFIQELEKQWGLTTDSDIAALKQEQDELKRYKDAIDNLPDAHTTQIVTEYVNTGFVPDVSAVTRVTGRASGGPVNAGTLYRVNERGVEGFRPNQSGSIVPLSDKDTGGGGINVTVIWSPSMSLGNEVEIKQKLIPLIIQGAQEARAQGKI